MAATAARASVAVPQATIGAWMCSASSALTSSRMAMATSTINRSAPRPERSTASACAMSVAWVTVAPLSIASLVAVVSWPLRVPTIRSRMFLFLFRSARAPSRALRLDDFRHGHAELFFHQHDLAAGDQAVVDINVDRLADLAVELEHGARADFEQVVDFHPRAAEHGGHLHRHVEHSLKVAGDTRGLAVRFHRARHLRLRRTILEIGQWHPAVVIHPCSSMT